MAKYKNLPHVPFSHDSGNQRTLICVRSGVLSADWSMTSSAPKRLRASALAAPLHTAITVAPTALLICRHCDALRAQPCLCRAEYFVPHCKDIIHPAHMCCNATTPQAFLQVRRKDFDYCRVSTRLALSLGGPAASCRTTVLDNLHLHCGCAHATCCAQDQSCLTFLQVGPVQQSYMGCSKSHWKTCAISMA